MEITKSILIIHQSARNDFCAEIVSPVKSKNNRFRREFNLPSLVEKYYQQAEDLPQLQSRWFDRPRSKYQKWRDQELLNRLRTAKINIRTQFSKKKDIEDNSENTHVCI